MRFNSFIGIAVSAVLSLSVLCFAAEKPSVKKPSPEEALRLLEEGNKRFVSGQSSHPNSSLKRVNLAGKVNQGDYAYATVLTCSDSRIPVERVFDAGVMDLFVIRVAGNIAGPSELASIEYGVNYVATPVLVVMGHTQCGAIDATISVVQKTNKKFTQNVPSLLEHVQPAVKKSLKKKLSVEHLALDAQRENVYSVISQIFTKSPVTRKLVKDGKLKVVGAIYHTGEGKVEWIPEAITQKLFSDAGSHTRKIAL